MWGLGEWFVLLAIGMGANINKVLRNLLAVIGVFHVETPITAGNMRKACRCREECCLIVDRASGHSCLLLVQNDY